MFRRSPSRCSRHRLRILTFKHTGPSENSTGVMWNSPTQGRDTMRKSHAPGRRARASAERSRKPVDGSANLDASIKKFLRTRPHLSADVKMAISKALNPPFA